MTDKENHTALASANYDDFITAKIVEAPSLGFDVDPAAISTVLFPFQRDIVRWAVKKGRAAIFAAFGLGKSLMQIEALRQVLIREGGRALIIAPLGVRQEFIRDAEMLGVTIRFVRRIEECDAEGIYITNYESVRDEKIDPREFVAVSLDEASVLRGFGGTKTFRQFMAIMAGDDRRDRAKHVRGKSVPYRFVATATPSPNEFIELLSYAAFLDVMDVGAAKTRFFKRDSTKADVLTIHPHKEREFWLFMASWAVFVTKPSDIDPSYDDARYVLPPMELHWHELPTDHRNAGSERDGQMRLVRDSAVGVSSASREKRDSLSRRVERMVELVRSQRIHAPLVSQEQGGSEGEESRGVPEEQGEGAGARSGVVSGSSGASERTGEALERGSPGGDSSAERGVVHVEQGEGGGKCASGEASAVRTDAESVSGHGRRAGRRVRNLRNDAGETGDQTSSRGPLPQDGQGSRPAVPEVQQGTRGIRGRPGMAHGSSGLSDQVIVWCDLNDEQVAICEAMEAEGLSVSSLTGTDDPDIRERMLEQWRAKKTTVFLSKPTMYGAGVNLQQCHTMFFAGIGFKFQDFIQAIHRVQRFQQEHAVHVYVIYTDAEREIRRALEKKWAQHNVLVAQMTAIVQKYGLARNAMREEFARATDVERREVTSEKFTLVNNDTVRETAAMDANSVDLILTSIPFAEQYEYSPSYLDFGHTDNAAHFWRQMDYLTPELFRVLQPGRIAAIHVKDRIVPGGITGLGFQTVYPFHADAIEHFKKHGFAFLGMKTIVTDVVRENNQTYRLGWTEQCKDGSRMGAGIPEYMLIFRKPPSDLSNGYADKPVIKDKGEYSRGRWQLDAHGFMRSSGNRMLSIEDLSGIPHERIFKLFKHHSLNEVYDYEKHVELCEQIDAKGMLPVTFMLLQPQSWSDEVWADVTRMLTLNGAQYAANRQAHICPMQFDIADRCITQYTMPGERVFDPFNGIGTVVVRSVKLGRHGRGHELNPNYFTDSVIYARAEERKLNTPTLFDLDAPMTAGDAAE